MGDVLSAVSKNSTYALRASCGTKRLTDSCALHQRSDLGSRSLSSDRTAAGLQEGVNPGSGRAHEHNSIT